MNQTEFTDLKHQLYNLLEPHLSKPSFVIEVLLHVVSTVILSAEHLSTEECLKHLELFTEMVRKTVGKAKSSLDKEAN